MIIETNDINGRRLLVAFTESSIAYKDITNVHRWYRLMFLPSIVASIIVMLVSITYAIVMYQNAAAQRPYQPYFTLLGGFVVSMVILMIARLRRPRIDWQTTVIPSTQVWVITVYLRSGVVYVYRYGSRTPELSLKLSSKDLSNLLTALNNEPWVRKIMLYEQ